MSSKTGNISLIVVRGEGALTLARELSDASGRVSGASRLTCFADGLCRVVIKISGGVRAVHQVGARRRPYARVISRHTYGAPRAKRASQATETTSKGFVCAPYCSLRFSLVCYCYGIKAIERISTNGIRFARRQSNYRNTTRTHLPTRFGFTSDRKLDDSLSLFLSSSCSPCVRAF